MPTPSSTFHRGLAATLLLAVLALALASAPVASAASEPRADRSGGRATAHHEGGRTIRSASLARRAPDAQLFDVGHDAVEPTLGLTKDGQVFYTAAGTRNEVVTSKDNGKTWKVVSPQLAGQNVHAISLDPYIYVDEDTGRVFTIDLTVACSLMSFSDDRGKTWTTNPLACGRPVNDHQTLFGGPPATSQTVGYKNVMYYCWNDVATSSCGKSIDGGISWRVSGSPAFHPGDGSENQGGMRHCGGLHGHGVVGRDGTIYLPKEHCEEPWLAISRDEGVTWDRVRVANKVAIWGPDPSVAVDDKGNIYYVFISKERLPYITTSRDGGETWSRPLMLAAPGLTETVHATLDVGGTGKIAVAYYGTDELHGKVSERDHTGVKWNAYITMSDDIFANDPVFYSGNVNDPKYPMVVGACGPRRCQDAVDFIDVVVGPEGTPWAAFADSCVSVCEGLTVGHTGAAARMVGGPSLR